MAQYINKNEVENILRKLWKEDDGHNSEHRICYNKALQEVQCELDTLEAKDVDLEKLINKYICDNFFGSQTLGFFANRTEEEPNDQDIALCAKHFFELGVKARTDKELIEEIYSHIDSIKNTADRMTSGNFMHNRAAIKFSANTIAKVLELIGLKAQKGK